MVIVLDGIDQDGNDGAVEEIQRVDQRQQHQPINGGGFRRTPRCHEILLAPRRPSPRPSFRSSLAAVPPGRFAPRSLCRVRSPRQLRRSIGSERSGSVDILRRASVASQLNLGGVLTVTWAKSAAMSNAEPMSCNGLGGFASSGRINMQLTKVLFASRLAVSINDGIFEKIRTPGSSTKRSCCPSH